MYAHCSLTHAGCGTDFGWRPLVQMAEREHQPLPIRQGRHRGGDLLPALLGQQTPLVRRIAGRDLLNGTPVVFIRRVADPALLAAARLEAIERGVHQDAREPDIEGQVASILFDVQEHFHEGVLHRFISIGRIAQVVERDTHGPPLHQRDQRTKPFARFVSLSVLDQSLDLSGNDRGRGRVGRGIGRPQQCFRCRIGGRHVGRGVDDGLSCHVYGDLSVAVYPHSLARGRIPKCQYAVTNP